MMTAQEQNEKNKNKEEFPVQKSAEAWKQILNPNQYYVLREKGTERPFSGEYNMHFEKGTYNQYSLQQCCYDSDVDERKYFGQTHIIRELGLPVILLRYALDRESGICQYKHSLLANHK